MFHTYFLAHEGRNLGIAEDFLALALLPLGLLFTLFLKFLVSLCDTPFKK